MENKLLNGMRKILNNHDPIGIYFGKDVNFDEYDSEIEDIYKIFRKCKNLDKFVIEVHKIFIKWFSSEVAGKKEEYIDLSKDLFNFLSKNTLKSIEKARKKENFVETQHKSTRTGRFVDPARLTS